MSESKNNSAYFGLGFCEVLTLIFITLKITDNINWSWWWVLAPTWLPLSALLVIALIVVISIGLSEARK